jgi:hypothetical protein
LVKCFTFAKYSGLTGFVIVVFLRYEIVAIGSC